MIICLDANIVIYYIERNPIWAPKVTARLGAISASDSVAVSEAALLECLVGPLRSGGKTVHADFERFFNSPIIQMLPVTAVVWRRAAEIRAAIEHGCGLFLTCNFHWGSKDREHDRNEALEREAQTFRLEVMPRLQADKVFENAIMRF